MSNQPIRVIPTVREKTENELMWEANGFFQLPDDAEEDSLPEGLAFASPDSDTTATKQEGFTKKEVSDES